MKEQGDTAREVEAKKMAAKEAIITSKQPMTKAANQQTGSRNEQRKKQKKHTQREEEEDKRDRKEAEASERATVEVMRKVRQLKWTVQMSQTASYGQWPQTDAKKAYGMAHKWDHWTRHAGRGGERACVGDKYRKNTTHIYSSVYVSVNKAEDEER